MWQLAWPWLLVLAPLPWFVRRARVVEGIERETALRAPAAEEFVPLGQTFARPPSGRLWRIGLLWMVWLLALVAAARPQYVGAALSLPMTGRDLLLAVDLSGSMEEQDFELEGEWVDRLTATKAVAREFIGRRVGDRIGLILFGRETYLQSPLTFDRRTVQVLLDESAIGLAGKETAIGDAIGLAVRTMEDAGVATGRRVLVLLTDGTNTAGAVEPLRAAALAALRGMIVYTVGVGADELLVRSLFGVRRINPSSDLDEETLQSIAAQTGGRYFRARDTAELEAIYGALDELEPAASEESGYRPVEELFYWPLGLAVGIALAWALLAALRLPVRLLARPSP
jgi:Ca-activated chloride channel family protein